LRAGKYEEKTSTFGKFTFHSYLMKRFYPVLATALLIAAATQAATAQAALWRPFQPGRIYTYGDAAAPTAGRHTLRVDSSYATTSGDSVYAFNQLMRQVFPGQLSYYRSRNNLFGARLRWQPGSTDYYLEANSETVGGNAVTPIAISVRLQPRAAVGSTWSASSQPALMATLTSRSFDTSKQDTVATITFSNGQVVKLGRQTGLLQGPQWLNLTASSAATWEASHAPQPLAQSLYSPLALFTLQPGDVLGYVREQSAFSFMPCYSGNILRRIVSRHQTADSLVLTYQEQERMQYFAGPTCGGTGGTYTSPIELKRWAFSLRTGQSPQFSTLGLLSGEYHALFNSTTSFEIGQGVAEATSTMPCVAGKRLNFLRVYGNPAPSNQYAPGLDAAGWLEEFVPHDATAPAQTGLGAVHIYETVLTYYRRTLAGTVSTCGSPTNFANLLATRAAEATALATVSPNPTTEQATLTFARPNSQPAALILTDALGRQVWKASVVAGQTTVTVPLAGQPAGLYLIQLQTGNAAPLTWKLRHE
jgi:hypothetical protein